MSDSDQRSNAGAAGARVLHVCADREASDRVAELLAAASVRQFDLVHSERLASELDPTEVKDVEVILLDVVDCDDETALARLREARRLCPRLPVVVVSDRDDEALSLQLLRAGCRGYLVRGELNTRRLVTNLAGALESHRIVRQLNIARERERHLITHDHLTSLANRVLFKRRLFQAVGAARSANEKLAVMVMDLDHFGVINETLGHAVGDGLLRSVAGHLASALGERDSAARLGGDEFALLLRGLSDEFEATEVAGRILGLLCKPIRLRSRSIIATGSIGIAAFPRDGSEPEQLIQRAHSAMEHAKRRGGNCYEFYTSDMNALTIRRATMEERLRTAIRDDALELHYQPQFDLRRERVVSAEALLRWRHPDLGLLSPETFLSVAEDSGLIVPLGDWVLHTACRQAAEWHRAGYTSFRISVNVSPMQFRERGFSDLVYRALETSGLRPEFLEIEITESCLVQDAEGTVNALHALKELGVHLAIDDFGTGYSALSYLKHLPIDVLKIDQSFVRTLATDPADATIVESVALMARGLNLTTVAEGVETREQLLLLGSYGVNRMQGYLFGKPMTGDELLELIRNPAFRWEGS